MIIADVFSDREGFFPFASQEDQAVRCLIFDDIISAKKGDVIFMHSLFAHIEKEWAVDSFWWSACFGDNHCVGNHGYFFTRDVGKMF